VRAAPRQRRAQLDVSWLPAEGVKSDVSAGHRGGRGVLRDADRRRPFRAWLAQIPAGCVRWDAGALYIRRKQRRRADRVGTVDGTTIIPLSDYYGRIRWTRTTAGADPGDELDGETVPHTQQVIQGIAVVWLTAEDLIYVPLTRAGEGQYGLAAAGEDLSDRQHGRCASDAFSELLHRRQPAGGLMEAPPDMSDPAQLQEWQDV